MKKGILFVITLSLLTFAACGKKAEEPQKPAAEAPKAEAPAAEAPKAEAKEAVPEAQNEDTPKDTARELILNFKNLPEHTVITQDYDPGSSYLYEYLIDSIAVISRARIPSIADDPLGIYEDVKLWKNNPQKISVEPDDAMSKHFSYPTWKIKYFTGRNEDTRENVAYLIKTDGMDHILMLSANPDFIDDYRERFDQLVKTVEFEEVRD